VYFFYDVVILCKLVRRKDYAVIRLPFSFANIHDLIAFICKLLSIVFYNFIEPSHILFSVVAVIGVINSFVITITGIEIYIRIAFTVKKKLIALFDIALIEID